MRIVLGVEYDGSTFHGWQTQHGLATVQETLSKALAYIANESVFLYCAGRTDTGVHALGQVLHFDTTAQRSLHAWVFGTNRYLPRSISVRWARVIDDHFHARFTAQARRYRYIIFNHRIRPALWTQHVTWYPYPLELKLMQEAASFLIGEHDFSAFRSAECNARTPIRHVKAITIQNIGNFVQFEIESNAFLHHMVRNIVGTLLQIGSGKKPPHWMKDVLIARNRCLAGETAPANGLYLIQVCYPAPYIFKVAGPMVLMESQ